MEGVQFYELFGGISLENHASLCIAIIKCKFRPFVFEICVLNLFRFLVFYNHDDVRLDDRRDGI